MNTRPIKAESKHEIAFNHPTIVGKEMEYIRQAFAKGKISGNGEFTWRCQVFFERMLGCKRALLTNSCTDALEMAALLANLQQGDEVIMPSYAFPSIPNAFILRGAVPVFVDSEARNPNLDVARLERHLTPRTKAIVVIHYAGVACDMDPIMELARQRGLIVIEDCAHAIDSFYKGRPLGSIGQLSAFSFHETKNIISGEGGMLAVNDPSLVERAEIMWEKGTNRVAFSRGAVSKYNWVDIGASYLASEITAAFLLAQLEEMDSIQSRRKAACSRYAEGLSHERAEGKFDYLSMPGYATYNGNMFALLCRSRAERDGLISHLCERSINATFHYLPLHESPYFASKYSGPVLPNCVRHAECLVRLPLYFSLTEEAIDRVIAEVRKFFP